MAGKGSCCVAILLALLVACHVSIATILVETESRLRCRCEKTVSAYINPRNLDSILIYPAGLACRRPEIILTLKKTLKKTKTICINPNLKWVELIMMQNGSLRQLVEPRGLNSTSFNSTNQHTQTGSMQQEAKEANSQ